MDVFFLGVAKSDLNGRGGGGIKTLDVFYGWSLKGYLFILQLRLFGKIKLAFTLSVVQTENRICRMYILTINSLLFSKIFLFVSRTQYIPAYFPLKFYSSHIVHSFHSSVPCAYIFLQVYFFAAHAYYTYITQILISVFISL